MSLTSQEQICLEIMSRDEDMLAIGSWENPILSLVAKGFVEKVGNVYRITARGCAAFNASEDDDIRDMIREHNARVRVIDGEAVEIAGELPCPR